ncbi:DUF2937 family protein [Roseibium sp. CAU 1637]|uniref:DUF2937 family protein n=1 Tax=Roseibium limicola TaxID=2816037 RepID=A0A939JAJ4_9HYPH|nr:DUF2937 family protein [Roseibium limicola]MBO0347004.1 DUF2937 family protein [Roseibium limicola]
MARLFVMIVAVILGTTTSQFPEFAQQYRQRLGGAIDALREVMTEFEQDAVSENLSVPQAIVRMQGSQDTLVARRGHSMERALRRLQSLSDQRDALAQAGPFARVVVVMGDLDAPLARATFEDFEPAVPVTGEGIASAAGGGLLGLILAWMGVGTVRAARQRRRRTRTI